MSSDATETAGHVDRPRAVRDGEQLDVEKLREHLAAELTGLADPQSLIVEQYPKGHSNLTYSVRFGDRDLVLRRPPFGARIKTAHDMHREFRVLSGLHGVYAQAPRPVLYCGDDSVIGAPFYLMERVGGIILRGGKLPTGLQIDPDKMARLSTELVDNLARLHAVDVEAAGLADFGGPPDGYVERQVTGWTRRYFNAKTDEVPQVEEAAAWLAANMPHMPSSGPGVIVHNDYKYDNMVLDPADPTRIIAVLDWEMATVGDPLMDLGTSLGYWIDPSDPDEVKMLPFGPTLLPGNLNRLELVERYASVTGREIPDPRFYYVFALFKIAVIAQQIYKRFKDGHTRDPRFAMMIMGVQLLGKQAVRAIEKGRIHDLG